MNWFRTHPYTSARGAAGVLVLIGAFIVVSRATRPVETGPTSWGGGAGPHLDPTSYPIGENASNGAGAPQGAQTTMGRVQDGPPYTYLAPSFFSNTPPIGEEDTYDFDAFVAQLSVSAQGPPDSSGMQDASGSTLGAYSYIPRGLISTTTVRSTRTPLQQELYDYGNDIGSTIESFEQQHSNMVQILKVQAEDRANPEKASAVVNLGHEFEELGKVLAAMEAVPSAMASTHKALAQSYIEIGKNLALVPGAERDSDFIQAIQTYNASADTFVKNYIQLVSLFGAYGVAFTSSDSGRVFTFSPTGSF